MHDFWDECEVDVDDIHSCVERLAKFMKRYQRQLGRAECQEHGTTYVKGRMEPLKRRTIEPIANEHGLERRPLQRFVGAGVWRDEPVLDELSAHVAEEIGSRDAVFIFDGSSFPKCGSKSAGVSRQWCGRLGKVDNCQVGEFLAYASPRGVTLVDCRLYLPKAWASNPHRRAAAHIPPEVEFRRGWELALEMVEKRSEILPHSWVLGDDQYGRISELRDRLHEIGERYLLEVPCDTMVGVGRGEGKWMRADRAADRIPKRDRQRVRTRDGAKGPIEVQAVKMRVATSRDEEHYVRETLLIIWRSNGERRYFLSNARGVSVTKLAKAHACRHYVEEVLREAKSEAGLDEYEVRSWIGWHHHMTLSLLAMFFLVCETNRLKKNSSVDRSPNPMGTRHHVGGEGNRGSGLRLHRPTSHTTAHAQ
jgi:SRSO17 transposase